MTGQKGLLVGAVVPGEVRAQGSWKSGAAGNQKGLKKGVKTQSKARESVSSEQLWAVMLFQDCSIGITAAIHPSPIVILSDFLVAKTMILFHKSLKSFN